MDKKNNIILMNYLGGWARWSTEWENTRWGSPPRNKEIGDVQVEKLPVQPLGIMGSALID